MGAPATAAVASTLLLPGGPSAQSADTVSDDQVAVTVAGGVDHQQALSIPTGELRAGVGTRRSLGTATWRASYSLLLQGWSPAFVADAHVLQLGASTPGQAQPGGTGEIRASLSQGWADAALGLSASLSLPGHVHLRLQGGPSVRGESDRAGLGVSATAVASRLVTPRLGVSARLDARTWRGTELVPSVTEADLSAWWTPLPRWSTWADVGWSRVGGTADTEPWAGLPGGGGHYARMLASAGFQVWRDLRLTVDLRVEHPVGQPGGTRVRALAGVSGQLGRLRGPGPTVHDPAAVAFEIQLAGVNEVLLVASFNSWTPVPLVQVSPGRWAVTLAVPPGEHEYLYLVDGEPYVPPNADLLRSDGFGGANVVLLVRDPGP